MEALNFGVLPRAAKNTTGSNVLFRRAPRRCQRQFGHLERNWTISRATGDESGVSIGADGVQQEGIGSAVEQGAKDARESLRWGNATVTENR